MNSGTRVVEVQLTQVDGAATQGYFLRLRALNRDNSLIEVGMNGADLVLRVVTLGTTVTSLIEANYTPVDGDIFGIEVDTTLTTGVCKGVLFDGALKTSAASLAYDNTIEIAKYMVFTGHQLLPSGEQMVIDSHLQAGDVSANTKPAYSAGAMDLVNNLI